MKKSFIISEEDYNAEIKSIENMGAREALHSAVYILRHDISQDETNRFISENKYFNGGQSKGNPQLSICSIARFYKAIAKRAEKEYPEFFQSVIEQIREQEKS